MLGWFGDLGRSVSRRWHLLWNGSESGERRLFAALELLCAPVSFLTVFVLLPLEIAAMRLGWGLPAWTGCCFTILLSAAIGYITNYIAIEMLFKPYERTPWHPLSVLTLGYWKQGLIPRNKGRIGQELGHQIETKLLSPEQLAEELCDRMLGFLHDEETLSTVKKDIRELLVSHEADLCALLTPCLADGAERMLERVLTGASIQGLGQETLLPRLRAPEVESLAVSVIVQGLQRSTPEMMTMLQGEVAEIGGKVLAEKLPFFGGGLLGQSMLQGVLQSVDWSEVESRLKDKLGSEEIAVLIRRELAGGLDRLESWLSSPASAPQAEDWASALRQVVSARLSGVLSTFLPVQVGRLLASEDLENWLGASLLPSLGSQLEQLIRTEGKAKIIEHLDLAGHVVQAVDRQDVREFHDMLNSIAAQHLGAIQVLGYFLGALVGLTQLLL